MSDTEPLPQEHHCEYCKKAYARGYFAGQRIGERERTQLIAYFEEKLDEQRCHKRHHEWDGDEFF